MTYRAILLNVARNVHDAHVNSFAIALAECHAAHLVGIAVTGISRFVANDDALNNRPRQSILEADNPNYSLEQFKDQARRVGIDYETLLVQDEVHGGIASLSVSFDLVVLAKINRSDPYSSEAPDLAEYVAMHTVRPVVVVPKLAEYVPSALDVLVAWDGSKCATRAITFALPILKQARNVHLVTVNRKPAQVIPHSIPGSEIALFLKYHGITCRSECIESTQSAAEVLMAASRAFGYGLIVLGCYGHSPLRETILGGTTRTMLDESTVPLLLAH